MSAAASGGSRTTLTAFGVTGKADAAVRHGNGGGHRQIYLEIAA